MRVSSVGCTACEAAGEVGDSGAAWKLSREQPQVDYLDLESSYERNHVSCRKLTGGRCKSPIPQFLLEGQMEGTE